MQVVSELYQTLIASRNHLMENRIIVAGEEYSSDRIISMEITGGLFEQDTVCAGSAVSRQLEVVLRGAGDIPKSAKLIPQYRVRSGIQVSEWVQKGVFYIDTREPDKATGTLAIHAFDDIMRMEDEWIPDQSLEFPMSMDRAAVEVARYYGVEIDPRTALHSDYFVDYPPSGTTGREIFRYIAAAHGGNWTMTSQGMARLVRLNDLDSETGRLVTEQGRVIDFGGFAILVDSENGADTYDGPSDKVFVGVNAANVSDPPALEPITKIVIDVDDDNCFEAGEDSGLTLEVKCPYGTQKMADNLLAELGGYRYRPVSAMDALIDPAAELGDGVTVNGVYTVLAQMDTTFDLLMASDIGAPGQREIESEIGRYSGPATKSLERQIAQTRSLITKTAEKIRLEVTNAVNGLSSSFTVQLEAITGKVSGLDGRVSTVEQTATGLTSTVQGLDGKYTTLQQTVDGFNTTVQGLDGKYTSLQQTVDGFTFKDAQGKVWINKGNINLTGAITWEDLNSGTQSSITTAAQNASDALGKANTAQGIIDNWSTVVGGRTYIDGGMVTSAVVAAKSLYGEQINFVSGDSGLISGYLEVQPTTTGTGVGLWSTSGMRVCANGNLFLASHTLNKYSGNPVVNGTTLTLFEDRIQTGFGPLVAGSRETLGTAGQPWGTIYSTSSSITVSDERRKHDIEPLPDKYADMIGALEPVRYRYNDGTSGRYHVGFIAQSVKAAMDELGIDSTEFGGYVADVDEDSNPIYLLRHEEFIGIAWAVLRKVLNRLNTLEARYGY